MPNLVQPTVFDCAIEFASVYVANPTEEVWFSDILSTEREFQELNESFCARLNVDQAQVIAS